MSTARLPVLPRLRVGRSFAPHVGGTAFFLLLISAFATRNPALMVAYLVVASGFVMCKLRLLTAASGSARNAMLLVVGVLTLMLPVSTFRNEASLLHYITVLVSLGAAYLWTRDLKTYEVASRWSLVAAQAVVGAYLFVAGLDDFPLENMLPDSSSNGITSYLVLLQANYCVVHFVANRRTSLATSLATLCICIVGYGRGSLLAAAAIVAVNLALAPTLRGRGKGVAGALLMVMAGATAYVWFGDAIATFVEFNTKIGAGLEDEPRTVIIEAYLGRIDAWTALVGAGYAGTPIAQDYFGNPHNSFIRAHHLFGLPYLLSMLAFPWLVRGAPRTSSTTLFCGAMLVIVLFRSFTEPILFPTLFDFYYFGAAFAAARAVAPKRLARLP